MDCPGGLAEQLRRQENADSLSERLSSAEMESLFRLTTNHTPHRDRYAFAQWWYASHTNALAAWVLLNPGVGDSEGTPRSILGRCRNLTRTWGFGGLIIVNLFAKRCRRPRELPNDVSAIGPSNNAVLQA